MNLFISKLRFAALVLGFLVFVPFVANAQTTGKTKENADFLARGKWHGNWFSLSDESAGFVYSGDLQLEVSKDNAVQGQFLWKLIAAPEGSEEKAKIGVTGVEYVKGKYNPASNTLHLEGYKLDDPQGTLALDQYRLIVSDDKKVIGGITLNNGTWRGLVSLEFAEKSDAGTKHSF